MSNLDYILLVVTIEPTFILVSIVSFVKSANFVVTFYLIKLKEYARKINFIIKNSFSHEKTVQLDWYDVIEIFISSFTLSLILGYLL
jgi:hypothetical protein